MNKFKLILLGLCLCVGDAFSQQAEALAPENYVFTLEQCLEYAFGNSYVRKSMQLSEEVASESYSQAKKERLPSVSASVGESLSHTGSESSVNFSGNAGVSASVAIYQGGSISNTIEQKKIQANRAQLQTAAYDYDLTIQIVEAFLGVLGNEELLKYQRTILKASEEQLEQGKNKFRVGSILESDYLVLEAQHASDLNNILETEISRENSLLLLKSLLSMEPSANLQILYPNDSLIDELALLPSMEEAVNLGLETMPSLKLNQSDIDLANVSMEISKAGWRPSLNANASVGTGHNNFDDFGSQLGDRFNQQIGLSLNIPIYDRGRTRSAVNQGKIALQQAELDKLQTELDIRQTITKEYMNVQLAYKKYKATDIKHKAYQKSFEAYNHKFAAGAIVAVDLLQQQNNYISALNEYIQAKYKFIFKRKVLDIYMGTGVLSAE